MCPGDEEQGAGGDKEGSMNVFMNGIYEYSPVYNFKQNEKIQCLNI